jgi:hypothetical protein
LGARGEGRRLGRRCLGAGTHERGPSSLRSGCDDPQAAGRRPRRPRRASSTRASLGRNRRSRLGVLVAGLFAVAQREAGAAAAVVAVGAFAVGARLDLVVASGSIDAVVAALVVIAIALRGRVRVAPLVLAGLLRPEAWILAAVAGFLETKGSVWRRATAALVPGHSRRRCDDDWRCARARFRSREPASPMSQPRFARCADGPTSASPGRDVRRPAERSKGSGPSCAGDSMAGGHHGGRRTLQTASRSAAVPSGPRTSRRRADRGLAAAVSVTPIFVTQGPGAGSARGR